MNITKTNQDDSKNMSELDERDKKTTDQQGKWSYKNKKYICKKSYDE